MNDETPPPHPPASDPAPQVPPAGSAQAPPPQNPPPSTTPAAGGISSGSQMSEKNLALAAHLLTLTNYISIPGFIGPLIIWLVKKDEAPFAAEEAKEALNFQITLYIAALICVLTIWLIIPFFLLIAIAILHVVFTILAALAVSENKPYRYPMNIRFIK